MRIVAITGSIGCGKTTLASLARQLGYVVYDADAWVRQLYKQKDFIKVITAHFPQSVQNGVFNKRALRTLVFDDNRQLKKLEALIHPFLTRTLRNLITKNRFSSDLAFLDAALLFEMGWDKYAELIVVADVDDALQKQRVMKRDGISAEDFDKINKVQMDKKAKILLADVVVDTNKPLNILKLELMSIIDGLENNG